MTITARLRAHSAIRVSVRLVTDVGREPGLQSVFYVILKMYSRVEVRTRYRRLEFLHIKPCLYGADFIGRGTVLQKRAFPKQLSQCWKLTVVCICMLPFTEDI